MIDALLISAALVFTRPAEQPICNNTLATAIYDAGFRGKNVREAWAIGMRESGGRPDAVSATGDYGVFQFNKAAHGGQKWWDTALLLTRKYNIHVAFVMSKGGRWWGPWDLSGSGQHLGHYTPSSVGAKYQYWYNRFPDKCKGLTK